MTEQRIRRAVLIVALLNFGYFFVEFAAAIAIGSASLFADSADFLEDTAINMLVFFAVAWPASRRRAAGSVLAALILIPAIAAIVTVVLKIMNPEPPSPEGLTGVAVGALVVNLICAVILLRLRNEGSSLATGAWLAARNDALANVLIIVAGLLTFVWATAWFDIIVGAIIAAVNLSAAKEVWEEAREEHDSVEEAFADMEDC
ncbi:Cation efflux family protein [Corynebacterium appendicis CIP 107643]|uniref:Cation efflux family protein n=1 Tax=Corynebacterium appendicis CIP 107643 TaxID=1161099 RepID=A0A1N7KAD3_9CORY|nr:cation transporter [Corynebacterium appendicis]WJY60514.1 Cadmium, cobalt and zinc/H(+)-K(+) antiporter [Corynebacterium appendicis CIP 107643]SIS58566.1 Cation efflux family protein [Corynebacterium appendicis CIP 107643]